MRNIYCVVAMALATLARSAAGAAVGYQELALPGTAANRALSAVVVYPTPSRQAAPRVADNRVFVGQALVRNAPPAPGPHPLVVLSHGYGGNWRNQLWLARALAVRGYVVAAPNHPGSTTGNKSPALGAQLWERPRDLSYLIDFMTTDPHWSARVAPQRIAAIGHSLGGWTVVELAGGRLDPQRLDTDCQNHAGLASCRVYKEISAGHQANASALLNQPLRDPRVRAIVSLDLGLARGFDPASLDSITVPALIVAAGPHHKEIPAELESAYLASQMPRASTRYLQIKDAGHFSFMQRCKPGAPALLEEDTPGDSMICQDGGGRPRAALHGQAVQTISGFLRQALATR